MKTYRYKRSNCLLPIAVMIDAFLLSLTTSHLTFAQHTNQFRISSISAPQFLTNAQKKSRPCLCQFGYGLRLHGIPLYDVTQIQDPKHLGHHSYGVPNKFEKNGTLYSCKNGFMDISHIRAGIDWTLFFAFQIANFLDHSTKKILVLRLEDDRAKLMIRLKRSDLVSALQSDHDILLLAQRLAYERLTWHEAGSWYTGFPNKLFSEEVSTFSIEDSYSNLLGTYIAKRAIEDAIDRPSQETEITADDILRWVDFELMIEMTTSMARQENQTKKAYDSVYGLWWDHKNSFPDFHVLKKRSVHVMEQIKPWLIPDPKSAGCQDVDIGNGQSLDVPLAKELNESRSKLPYDFKIIPFESNYRSGHSRLPRNFTSFELPKVIEIISRDFRRELGRKFDRP